MAFVKYTAASRDLSFQVMELRREHGFTQQQLAQRAGIKRATISQIESGSANPSMQTLLCLCDAFGIKIGELLLPALPRFQILRSHELPIHPRSKNGLVIKKLIPAFHSHLELDQITLEKDSSMKGAPHTWGTFELTLCLKGILKLTFENRQSAVLKEGDVVRFPGSIAHSYHNESKDPVIFVSLVALGSHSF